MPTSRLIRSILIPLMLGFFASCTPFQADDLVVSRSPTVPVAGVQEVKSSAQVQNDCQYVIPAENPRESPFSIVIEPFDLLVPSGNRIYGLITRPDPELYADECFPAVISIPGGINPGRMQAYGAEARVLAEAGVVVINFNAEGRVDDVPDDIRSEGSEDFNGYRHQDSLCALVRYVIALEFVIPENVGLRTQSFGITMGSGCAARYPEIPIKYIVDGEGPPNSFVTVHEPYALDDYASNDKHDLVAGILGHYSTERDGSLANIAFWEKREAIRFIGDFRGRYLRLQATWDHAQPPAGPEEILAFDLPPRWWHNKHTTDIVNAAVQGGVPWVRVNLAQHGNPINAIYDYDNPPLYLAGELKDQLWGAMAVLEMVRME